jgi:RimJ/RimL family protein N-acetyltransferase
MIQTLTTNRLTLRPFRGDDAPDLVRLLNNYNVSQWLTRVRCPYSVIEAHWYIGALRNPWRFAITSRETGAFMGCVEVGTEFGYWLGQPFWRQGYMSEAANAVVNHWMGQYGDTLVSSYFLGNTGSQTILTALGFEPCEITYKFSKARDKEVKTRILTLTPMRYHAHKAH